MSVQPTTRAVPSEDLISTTIDGEEVILHLGSGTYFGLDGVGARIWELVSEGATVGEVLQSLDEEFDVDRSRLETDVEDFLLELNSENLVRLEEDG